MLVILTITLMFSTVVATFFRPGRVSADTALLFNEGYGTSVNDSNGNVSAGTITGSVWRTDDLCRRDKCLYFDGSGDKVTFSDNADLDFSATNTFTISGWFRHPVISTNPDYLVTKHQSGVAGGYKIYMDSDGDISFGIDDDGTWGPEDVIGDDQGKNYDDNRWHHFAAVKNGTTGIYLYVDGVLIDEDTSLAANGSLVNAASFYVGIDADGSSNSWDGFIDEVKVVRQARSAAQVLTDYLGSGVPATGNGPVAHWKFDENTGTATYDSTSNGNNSTTWTGNTTWAAGKYGSALSFDGTDDVVRFTETTSTDLGGSSSYTLAAWFKTTANFSNNAVILSKYNATGTLPFGLYLNPSEQGVFQFGDAGSNIVTITGATALNDGGWHHIVGVRDVGADTAYLYIDGKLIGSSNDITTSSMVNNNDISIGNAGTSYLAYDFNGQIDDVRIYDYARSATQVLEDINANLPPGVSASFGSDQSYLSNGLVGYWKMDENTGTTTSDSSGNNNTSSTFSGDVSWVTGVYGSGLSFDGTGDRVSVADAAPIDFGSNDSYTVSAWVYKDNDADSGEIISKRIGGSGYPMRLIVGSDERITFNFRGSDIGTSVQSPSGISLNSWHHIVGVRDLATDTAYLYIDGVLVASANDTTTGSLANNAALTFGDCDTGSGCSGNPVDIQIDEVRLYNRSLGPLEVLQLSKWAAPPVGWWKLDESSNATANDSSGNNNNLTNNGTVLRSPGKFGSAGEFDNSESDNLSITDGSQVGLDFTSSFTIGFWLNRLSNGACDDVMGKSDAYAFYFDCSDTTIVAYYYNGSTTPSTESATGTVNDGQWVHVEFVHNDTQDTDTMYINGVLSAQNTGRTTNAINSSEDFMLGGSAFFPSQLHGFMDDVRVYNYARTLPQVVEDMNGGHPAPGSPIGSALAHYKFDEGAHNTCSGGVNDACNSGNGGSTLDGAVSGMALPATSTSGWSNNGVFGGAMNFDGTDDAVTLPVNSSFNLLTGGTISAWLYPRSSGEGSFGRIIDKSNDTNGTGGYTIEMDGSSTRIMVEINDVQCETTAGSITQSAWNHFVWAFNGVNWNLYVNGKLNTTCAYTTLPSNTSLGVTIGNRQGATDRTFNGLIDEVKIYTSILSADQVMVEYNRGEAIVLGALSTDSSGNPSNSTERSYCPPGDATATCSPVGEWKLDENTGTSAYDISTVSNTGTLNGTSLWEPGKVGQAVKFDGSSGYISVPYSASQDPTANLTVSFWFKPTVTIDSSIASNKGLISKANTNTDANNDWVFFWNSADAGRMRFGTYGDNIQTTNATWTAGTWYHIEAVVTSTNTANIYVNGKLDTYNADSNISTDPINGNQNTVLNIGLAKVASGDLYCSCTIDHFRLYDYARSFSQVAWDYALGMPHAWWRFDEGSGSSANDATGNGNTGTVTIGGGGSQTTTTQAWSNGSVGKYNGSINLDGNDDYVTITESDTDGEMDFNSGDQITVTAWINPSSLPAADEYDTIVGKNNSGNGDGYYAQYQGNGAMEFCTINTGAFDCISSTTTPVVAGSWQFLVFTVTLGTDTSMKMYYNGRLQPNGGNGNNVAPPLSNDPIVIGANNGGTEAVTGKIDDVRIYRYTLSQQQIQTVMNQGAVRFNQ